MRLFVALLGGFLLAGCGTTSSDRTASPDLSRESEYASGPLVLPKGAQGDLARYLEHVGVGAFAVGRGGATWFYMLCPSEDCNLNEVIDDTLDVCNRRSRPYPCGIYAIGPKIVWNPNAIRATSSDLPRESEYASGPLALPKGALGDIARYMESVRVGAFAVGRGGATWFYMLCPSEDCNLNEVIDDTLDVCNRRSRPDVCGIYAIGRKIVWNPDAIRALFSLRDSELAGSEPWLDATDQLSNVHVAVDSGIIAPKQFRHVATSGGKGSERDFEKVQLTDGGTVFYEALTSNAVRFEPRAALADYVWPAHSAWLREEHGIELSATDVRRRSVHNGEIAYAVVASESGACFVSDLVFWMPNAARIDRHVEIALCRPASNWSKERLEQYAFDLLARFGFGPSNYNPLVGGS